jgi:DNA polymerase III subunit beta
MKFIIEKEVLLKPLQLAAGVVEKRNTLPILANILLKIKGKQLFLIGTDLDIELQGKIILADSVEAAEITVPAYKFLDICRTLPENALLEISVEGQKVIIRSNKSRFSLTTLPAVNFPSYEKKDNTFEFSVQQTQLRKLIESTAFAMAQQDVRYYLNGMLWEVGDGYLRAVSTDGHRMALSEVSTKTASTAQFIVPRKSVFELQKLLVDSEDEATICVGASQLSVTTKDYTFTSKLIDGQFPSYNKVIPKVGDNVLEIDRDVLKQALLRVATLANDKFRSVRVELQPEAILISANNTEFEEAEEELHAKYVGKKMSIGFNVNYLIDVINVVSAGNVKLSLYDPDSSVRVEETNSGNGIYVIMPMRL